MICFLRWANLKDKPPGRYESPLLMLPVKLAVKKGIHDRYLLTALETQAEVNPVVRHLFKQWYDIDLPVSIDPTPEGIAAFHADLNARIQAGDPSVTLTKVDRPRIDLIHEKARRRLDQFRRHARLSGRGIRSFLDLDYSYDSSNYHPLGVRIFKEFVRPAKTHLEQIVSTGPPPPQYMVEQKEGGEPEDAVEPQDGQTAEPPPVDLPKTQPRTSQPATSASAEPPVAEAERKFYQVRKQKDDNPYNWEFDLCSVTLSNLRYRRMSLVRDYGELADDTSVNPAFEATFAIAPREVRPAATETLPLAERFHVVSCDPTQTHAIALARSGTSYIIQGPPGTGKSQTITNLIADFVVRGKRVLFVCEKRAAIDVVYHRLKQRRPARTLLPDSRFSGRQERVRDGPEGDVRVAPGGRRQKSATRRLAAVGVSSASSRKSCSRSSSSMPRCETLPTRCAWPLRDA